MFGGHFSKCSARAPSSYVTLSEKGVCFKGDGSDQWERTGRVQVPLLLVTQGCTFLFLKPAHTQVRHCPGVLTWQEGGRSLSRLPSDGSPTPTPPQCQGELSSVSRCSRLLEVALGSAPGLLSCPPSLPPDTGLTPLRTGGGTSGGLKASPRGMSVVTTWGMGTWLKGWGRLPQASHGPCGAGSVL